MINRMPARGHYHDAGARAHTQLLDRAGRRRNVICVPLSYWPWDGRTAFAIAFESPPYRSRTAAIQISFLFSAIFRVVFLCQIWNLRFFIRRETVMRAVEPMRESVRVLVYRDSVGTESGDFHSSSFRLTVEHTNQLRIDWTND